MNPAFVGLVIAWGFLVSALGMTQVRLLVGNGHWVVQVLHLLVGMGAMGLAEGWRPGSGNHERRRFSPEHREIWSALSVLLQLGLISP